MTDKYEDYDVMNTSVKKEYEEVTVSETNIYMNDTKLNGQRKCNNIIQYDKSSENNIKTGLSLFKGSNFIVNENIYIKDETSPIDVNVVFKDKHLFCKTCCEEYKDYCTKCGMAEHILNRNTFHNTRNKGRNGKLNDILEIRESSGHCGIFTLKVIPEGVTFGPFTGPCASKHSRQIKDGKFVIRGDNMKESNWTQYINATKNISTHNLLVFQCEGSLYYRSNREIQEGEELLVSYGEGYDRSMNKGVEIEFNPAIDGKAKDVYACTLCCLEFNSKIHLSQHKTICPYKTDDKLTIQELTQCPSCKVYLEEKEYSEYHRTDCDGGNGRQHVPSSPDLKGAKLKTISSTLKEWPIYKSDSPIEDIDTDVVFENEQTPSRTSTWIGSPLSSTINTNTSKYIATSSDMIATARNPETTVEISKAQKRKLADVYDKIEEHRSKYDHLKRQHSIEMKILQLKMVKKDILHQVRLYQIEQEKAMLQQEKLKWSQEILKNKMKTKMIKSKYNLL